MVLFPLGFSRGFPLIVGGDPSGVLKLKRFLMSKLYENFGGVMDGAPYVLPAHEISRHVFSTVKATATKCPLDVSKSSLDDYRISRGTSGDEIPATVNDTQISTHVA